MQFDIFPTCMQAFMFILFRGPTLETASAKTTKVKKRKKEKRKKKKKKRERERGGGGLQREYVEQMMVNGPERQKLVGEAYVAIVCPTPGHKGK